MIETNKKANLAMALNFITLVLDFFLPLKRIPYIYYLMQFKKNWAKV